jgi:DNA-binding PadR family transcriptional regulator
LYVFCLTLTSTKKYGYDCKSNIKEKGNDVHSIISTITVYEALKVMGEKTGAVLLLKIIY